MAAAAARRDDAPMKSQVAITVSGHVFAYPTVVSVGVCGFPLQPQAPTTAAQDAPHPVATAA